MSRKRSVKPENIVVGNDLMQQLHLQHNVVLERRLIEVVVRDRKKFDEAANVVAADDFFDTYCRRLWRIAEETYAGNAESGSIEIMTAIMADDKSLFAEYLEITKDFSIAENANPRKAALAIKELSIARRYIATLIESFARCSREQFDALEEIPLMQAKIGELIPSATLKGFADPAEIIAANYEFAIQSRAAKSGRTVPTHLPALDNLIGGFPRKKLMIIGARPSIGKTSLAVGCALDQLTEGRRVGFFSIEMPREEIVLKMQVILSGVSQHALTHLDLTADERDRFLAASVRVSESLRRENFFLDDGGRLTIARARSMMRRMRDAGAEVIYIDYIQLMDTVAAFRDQTSAGRFADVSRELKALAKELDVCVVALAQLNRERKDGSDPHLADLKESGGLEQDADVVMFLNRPEFYGIQTIECPGYPSMPSAGLGKALVRKYRGGPTGEVMLRFNKSISRFEHFSREDIIPVVSEPKTKAAAKKAGNTFF